jgi:hypothetical protein
VATCVLTAGMLSRYCEDDRRFLVGAQSLTDEFKFCTIDNVNEITDVPKMVRIGGLGAAPQKVEI